jgi:hypothetical protein
VHASPRCCGAEPLMSRWRPSEPQPADVQNRGAKQHLRPCPAKLIVDTSCKSSWDKLQIAQLHGRRCLHRALTRLQEGCDEEVANARA